MKKLRLFVLSAVALLLAVVLILYVTASSPMDVVKSRCLKNGWQNEDLEVLDFSESNGVLGGRFKVNIQVRKDPPHTVHAELRRPPYSRNWGIVTYEDGSASVALP